MTDPKSPTLPRERVAAVASAVRSIGGALARIDDPDTVRRVLALVGEAYGLEVREKGKTDG